MKGLVIALYVLFFWLLLPLALFASSLFLDNAMRWPLLTVLRPAGAALVVTAVPLLVLAIVQYTKAAGELPVSAYPAGRVIRAGVFAVWRHPIYLFFTALLYGAGMAWGSPAMVLVVMPAFIALELICIRVEEGYLVKRFGPDYLAHQEETRLVLPGLHHGRKFALGLLARFRFPIRVVHPENVPQRAPFFMVSSHRSYLDPFIIEYCLPYRLHYVTTFEVFRSRFSAFVFSVLFGCIPKKRYTADLGAMQKIRSTLRRGGVIGVFPEGERSFTGAMLELKAPVARLFKRYPDVPVFPVVLSGNYLLWPRWGRGLRRSPVRVEFKPLLRFRADQADREVLAAVVAAIRPDDRGLSCRGKNLARDIGLILYRCPACRAFDRLEARGDAIVCAACGSRYAIDRAYSIRTPDGRSLSIDDFYQGIRVDRSDIAAARIESAPAEISLARGAALTKLFLGRLVLLRDRIVLEPEPGQAGAQARTIPLRQVRAATIEKSDRLQIYDGHDLFQAAFRLESARKWQDLVAAMAEQQSGALPTLR
jgi:1-acyl-sn-glycerol-3-phosphate acyltransferase